MRLLPGPTPSELPELAERMSDLAGGAVHSDSLRVLLVDDDPELVQGLSHVLSARGFLLTAALTGEEGLRAARALDEPPAIALVDLKLPDMDGLEVVHRLHERSRLTQVVILTGHASFETAVRALRERIFDYLTKPVEPGRLIETLERARERWRLRTAETALVRSEERLRRIFEAIADSVFITDASGCIVDANDSALALSGFSKEDLQHTSLSDLVRPAQPAGSPKKRRRKTDDVSVALGEHRLTTREGEELVVEVRTAGFGLDRFVHTVRDETERHRLEEQLRRAQRMEAVGQLAGGLAHDFNNVLTAITGYGELLRLDVQEGSEAAESVAEILEAAGRAARLTRELLTFSRRQVVTPKILELNTVVAEVRPMLSRLVREDVRFEVRLGADLGTVRVDKGRVEQVIANLVVNAADAMPKGGTLTIATDRIELDENAADHIAMGMRAGVYVTLTIEDTGIGMDSATLDQIFEPFFTTKDKARGTGLGLATVYGIVKQSEGQIQVESEPGEGSRFTIYLPARSEPPEDAAQEDRVASAPMGTETVLLAEDDPMVRSFVERALAMNGYTVLTAEHSEEVLEIAKVHEGPIHLIFSDVVMPGLRGPELAAEVVGLRPDVRVIFASGYHSEPTKGPIDDHDGFLEKPFRTEDLLHEVRRVLDLEDE